MVLVRGARARVAEQGVLQVSKPAAGGSTGVELVALRIGDGSDRHRGDVISSRAPVDPEQAVRSVDGGLEVVLERLPEGIDRVVVALASKDGHPLEAADVEGVRIEGIEGGPTDLQLGEPDGGGAHVVAEVYRRDGTWRVACRGEGVGGGLPELASRFGLGSTDGPQMPTNLPIATPQGLRGRSRVARDGALTGGALDQPAAGAASTVSFVKERRELLKVSDGAPVVDLRKKAVVEALQSAGGLAVPPGRVIYVSDASGSNRHRLDNGTMGRTVERFSPIAAVLDRDKTLENLMFAAHPGELPSVRADEPDLARYFQREDVRKMRAAVGNDNVEDLVMRLVVQQHYEDPDASDHSIVVMLSDGGIGLASRKYGPVIENMRSVLRSTKGSDICFLFVGQGPTDDEAYGPLRELATPRDGEMQNAFFFAVNDLGSLTDEQLYGRLVGPVARWHAEAARRGILRRPGVRTPPPADVRWMLDDPVVPWKLGSDGLLVPPPGIEVPYEAHAYLRSGDDPWRTGSSAPSAPAPAPSPAPPARRSRGLGRFFGR